MSAEEVFVINSDVNRMSVIDAMSRRIAQASGVLAVVLENGCQEDFIMSHEIIVNSLWTVGSLLDELKSLLNHPALKRV